MHLIYSIKIKSENGVIVELTSPHLRVDFFPAYINSQEEQSLAVNALRIENFRFTRLSIVMDEYVKWIQDNNYILRLPNSSPSEVFQLEGEQWINVQVDTLVKKGMFEHLGQVVGISLFLMTLGMSEFFFVLAARLNKVPYATLILPIITDFTMAGIVYAFSGATSNIIEKGKELDDWWNHRIFSPREIEFNQKHPVCSSWYLSKVVLFILPIASTTFGSFAHWQGLMSMHDKFEMSNANDPIITPKFIYYLAIISTAINAIYMLVQLTSFSLKATNILKASLDKIYYSCVKSFYYVIQSNHYSEVLSIDKEEENAIRIDGTNEHTMSTMSIVKQLKESDEDVSTVYCITQIVYQNPLLNRQDLLIKIKNFGGIRVTQEFVNLGNDVEVANAIIEYIEQYGVEHVVSVLFAHPLVVNKKIAPNDYNMLVSSQLQELNFFFDSNKGIDVIQAIAKMLDVEDLHSILELGKDSDIVEQILSEIELQGINRVIATLLGNEIAVEGSSTDNVKNIIGMQELSRLQLVSNGIFNGWSNRVYHKVVEYIDNLAKNLDDLLNTGKSGNQVAVTLALLEEWLGFAASGQRFIGGRPPYYNLGDNDDWSYGGSGSGDGGNNSLAGSFDNQYEVVGLILPLYNGTNYNMVDY